MTTWDNPPIVRRGSGTTIVFIHGSGVDHRLLLCLDHIFETPEIWERIYLDLPGFGGTRALGGRGGLPDLLAWLESALERLVGSAPFALVANSLGGLLAQSIAAQRPNQCRGMALLAPVVEPTRENRRLPCSIKIEVDPHFPTSLTEVEADTYLQTAVNRSQANWQRYKEAALPGIQIANQDAIRRLENLYTLPRSALEGVEKFRRPVLIIAGRQDDIVGFEDQWTLAKSLSCVTYAALDRCGHNVHLDQPRIVNELLSTWMRQVRGVVD